jgi:hypothetical protein
LHDLGRNDSAYYYLELSRKMTMDIYSEKSMQQMAVLQVMYDIAKKMQKSNVLTMLPKPTK